MTEADLTQQMLDVTAMTFHVVSVVFGIISAYVVGLYWFLHRSGFLMKLVAFMLLTMMLGVMGVAIYGTVRHSTGISIALIELGQTTELSALGKMATENTASAVARLISLGTAVLALSIYLGLGYLTFIHKWTNVDRSA